MPTPLRISNRTADLHASPIREILAVVDRPGMISFAGGLPAADSFPVLPAAQVPPAMLQYGPSEGEPALRAAIAAEVSASGLSCQPEQVLVLSGSQQGIDLVAKLFIDPGTAVALESPSYLAALQVFRFFGARFVDLDPAAPRTALAGPDRPALAYVIPTFQNPTGRCHDAATRRRLAQACDRHGVTLFEDDPYRALVYADCTRTPICAQLKDAAWIYQGSFSKNLAPGLRLGYLLASPVLLPWLTRLKQAADLHSNRISQWLVLEQLRDPARPARLAALVQHYRARRDAFALALKRHLAPFATWETPPGGLFFWLRLHASLDTRTLLPAALERGVAFMPGEPFFAQEQGARSALRLNFSHADEAQAERGLAILAELLANTVPASL